MRIPRFQPFQRIAILIDRDDLLAHLRHNKLLIEYTKPDYSEKIDVIPIGVYLVLSDRLIESYCHIARWDRDQVMHMGTWMFPAIDDRTHTIADDAPRLEKELLNQEYLKEVDSLQGFIIRYGFKSYRKEPKATDTHLVCQMLIGAFQDEYDVCILVSDDDEFIPPIELVQNMFGKRVIHAGFQADRLRAIAFGHIPFESAEFSFDNVLFKDVYDRIKQ